MSLTREGQRKARVNACRLHQLDDLTKVQEARAYTAGLNFFDLYYLHADHEVEFDPMFYDDVPLPSPKIHWDVASQWATERLCIAIAPRGSAKSFLVKKSILFEMISRSMFSILYATSTGDNTKALGQSLKDQFSLNSRLHDDWAPEYPVHRIAPKRGEAPFGATHMQIMNGSWIRCISSESKQRGGRPRLYVLDDPEFDPKAATSMQILRQYMDQLLFKVVLPMVMRAGCKARWLATFVSRRHYAWHAMDVSADGRAKDPRFDRWDRILIDAEYYDQNGKKCSCWPEMWPATTEERLELAKTDRHYEKVMSLEEIELTIGRANYLSEYRGRPGEGDEIFFPVLTEEKHGHYFKTWDDLMEREPWRSQARLCYQSTTRTGEEIEVDKPLSTFCQESRLFMTVDTSYTASRDSDFKVCCLMAVTPENDLVVLDLWSGQCHQPELIKQAFQMANRWRCPSIHVEAIKEGITVYNDLLSVVNTKAYDQLDGVTHLPTVRKFNPGMTSKQAKIASLGRRFEFGKIKLPLRRRSDPYWRNLFAQIEEFNPDAPDGGLQHDDEIDCVAMHMYVVRGRVGRLFEEKEEVLSPLEKMKRGELRDDAGNPLALGIDWSQVPLDDVYDIMTLGVQEPGRASRL
jgi:phage terminase large subunit-like protein